jgi:hypothetical protein
MRAVSWSGGFSLSSCQLPFRQNSVLHEYKLNPLICTIYIWAQVQPFSPLVTPQKACLLRFAVRLSLAGTISLGVCEFPTSGICHVTQTTLFLTNQPLTQSPAMAIKN